MKKYYIFVTSAGEHWQVPTMVIAEHRADYYAKEFEGGREQSLKDDTIPLFSGDEFEIEDWARNSMNWDMVKPFAKKLVTEECDMQKEWTNPAAIDFKD